MIRMFNFRKLFENFFIFLQFFDIIKQGDIMIKKIGKSIVSYVKDEYRFLLGSLIIYIILLLPVNYYITIGGGISDSDSRVEVENAYDVKGSFNISYVEQVRGKVVTYLLSYVNLILVVFKIQPVTLCKL